MPRTPLTSTTSASSSHSSNNSEHFPYRYVDLEKVINIFSQRENVATAINLANNDRTAFTEIAFLNYLIQNIRRKEIQLEKDKRLARARIARLYRKSLLISCINGSLTQTSIPLSIFQSDHLIPVTTLIPNEYRQSSNSSVSGSGSRF
jgi:hypothetical protein